MYCFYWDRIPQEEDSIFMDVGFCRRHAPRPFRLSTNEIRYTVHWPVTIGEKDICGEFKDGRENFEKR